MGDGLIVAVFFFQAVPNSQAVAQMPIAQVILRGINLWLGVHHLQKMVIQRVLRQQAVKLVAGQFLVDDGKRRVKEPDGLLIKGQQLILLRTEMHRIAQGKAVLFLRLGRRVQFIVGRLHRRGQRAVQPSKHIFTAFRQVSVLPNDSLHGIPHHGQNEVALAGAGVHLFLACAERARTGHQIPSVYRLIGRSELLHIVLIVVNNGAKFLADLGAGGN